MLAVATSCAHRPQPATVETAHCVRVVALGEHGASVLYEEGAPSFVKGARPVARYHLSSHPDRPVETLTVDECRQAGLCEADGRFRAEAAGLRPASHWELAKTSAPGAHELELPGLGARQVSWELRESRFGEQEWALSLEHGADPWVLWRTPASFKATEVRWLRAGDSLWVEPTAARDGVRCLSTRVDLRETAAAVLNDEAVKLLREEKLEEARKVLERAVEVSPQDATAAYNLACALALSRDEEGALAWLDRAVRLDEGQRLAELALTDPDLEVLRTRPEFGLIVGQRRSP